MEYKNSKTANRRRYKSRYHSPHNYKAKNPSSGSRAPILIGIATFVVLASLVLVFAFGDNIYAFLDKTFHPTGLDGILPVETMGVEVVGTEAPTLPEPVTEAPTEPPARQNDEFSRLLAAAGLKLEDLTGSQAIFVESAGTSAKVYCYMKGDDGLWTPRFDAVNGYVGAGGVSASVGPTDNTTPTGTYHIEYSFGTNPDPGTPLRFIDVYVGLRWVTDPASYNYNRLVDVDEVEIDYQTCQELHEYTKSYPYAVVFDYNRGDYTDPTMGCARFLHVADGPTRGGVGVSEQALESILLWLDPEANPTISIF